MGRRPSESADGFLTATAGELCLARRRHDGDLIGARGRARLRAAGPESSGIPPENLVAAARRIARGDIIAPCWRSSPPEGVARQHRGELSAATATLAMRAPLRDPRCLLDEPTEASAASRRDRRDPAEFAAKRGLTMILVEQNLDFIAALSQRILIIQKGAITREVAPAELGDASLVGEFVGIAT